MAETRRRFLTLAGMAPLACVALGSTQALANACVDPDSLPLSQKNRRRAIGYVDPSTDAKKKCSLCSFFTAGQAGCGTCMMLSGGPVSADAVCNSFALKAG